MHESNLTEGLSMPVLEMDATSRELALSALARRLQDRLVDRGGHADRDELVRDIANETDNYEDDVALALSRLDVVADDNRHLRLVF